MKVLLLLGILYSATVCHPQEVTDDGIETRFESQIDNAEEIADDDSWLEQLSFFRKHPLNINTASESELAQILILSPLQISNLIRYRSLLGPLVHVNELQAVPGWDIRLIRKLLPFISVSGERLNTELLRSRLKMAEPFFLIRTTQQLSKIESSGNQGGPQTVLIKLQYNYGRKFQSGILMEKDAGEPWLVNKNFDFSSFHFFIRDWGVIKKLAVGDFLINFGQGLIQWQGMGVKKSANVLLIKKQDEMVRPYRAAGEINFHRGLAIVLSKRNWQWSAYASIRKRSAHTERDSINGSFISSFSNSGYHRTTSEIENRNNVKQVSAGTRFTYAFLKGNVGFNTVAFHYSLPIERRNQPYLLFELKGKQLFNSSMDYDYTFRNMHVFGEFAVDHQLNKAWMNGLLASLDERLDLSIVFRSISPAYSSINANTFTESSTTVNETGLYVGISHQLSNRFKIDAYADIFSSRWLRYQVDAPSTGSDFIVQFNWQANRRLNLYGRWKIETKEENSISIQEPSNVVNPCLRRSFRAHLSWDFTRELSIKERWETGYYQLGSRMERGALMFTEVQFHPSFKPFDVSARLLLFDTDSYDSRIYAVERNVLNGVSVPFFYGKGVHAVINVHYDLKQLLEKTFLKPKEIGFSLSLSHTLQSINNQTPRFDLTTDVKKTTVVRLQIIIQ